MFEPRKAVARFAAWVGLGVPAFVQERSKHRQI